MAAIGHCRRTSASAGDGRDDERAGERAVDLAAVAGARRLGGQAGRRHAQRAEAPEQEVEDDGAERHGAEEMRLAEPSDHGRVDEAEQRRRHMRQGHRQREHQHAPVVDLDVPVRRGRVHRCGSAAAEEAGDQPDGDHDDGAVEDPAADFA